MSRINRNSTSANQISRYDSLAVISTALPSITFAIAAQKLPATLSATTQLLIPVIATLSAAAILHEMPSVWLIPGGGLVLIGIAHMFRESGRTSSSGQLAADIAPEFAGGD